MSEIQWVGSRFLTYFPEEFPAQISKIPPLIFSGLSILEGRDVFAVNPQDIPTTIHFPTLAPILGEILIGAKCENEIKKKS